MAPQAAILLLALALWTVHGAASLWSLAAAYGLAWLAVNTSLAARPEWLRGRLTRAQAAGIAIVIALPAAAQAYRARDAITSTEGLAALDHLTSARLRLEQTPSIAPPLVASDRPQTFYVHAPGSREVAVRFGRTGPRVGARALGHGLFRVEYDPRAHGPPDPPDGELYAILSTDGDAHSRAMLAVTPLAHPRWLAPSPDRRRVAAVSEETDEVYVIDRAGLALRAATDDGPVGAVFVSDRELVVAHRYGDHLTWIDAGEAGRVLRRRRVGSHASWIAVSNDRRRIALALGGTQPRLAVLDAADGRPIASVNTEFTPDRVVFAGDVLVASSVRPPVLHQLRVEDRTIVEARAPLWLGRPAVAMAAHPDGASVLIAVTDLSGEGPPHLGNHFVQDQLVTVDVERWTSTRELLTARRTNRQQSPGNVDRGGSPMGIDVREDGSALVAFAGTDEVWRVDPSGGPPQIIPLDEHPLAAPLSAVGLAGGGFAVSSAVYGTVGIFSARGTRQCLVRIAPGDQLLLARDPRALQRRIGERTFYESTEAGVSCQSCHLHGASDGTAHNIGGYTRVGTLDVRGVMGTPPYLRDGGYPLLASFGELADTLYRG